MKIRIVSATRHTAEVFWKSSALGNSLRRVSSDARLVPRLTFENRAPLADVYNAEIVASGTDDLLVFMHDDLWIDDYFFADRIMDGLARYDVIGVAGNRRRQPGQPSWAFPDLRLRWDEREFLSGAVAHGKLPFGAISWFGATPAECELLDGVLLASSCVTLSRTDLRFDPRFSFHFYDLDFCRTARLRGLRLGTWPIALTHQSSGGFNTPQWRKSHSIYLHKWESDAAQSSKEQIVSAGTEPTMATGSIPVPSELMNGATRST